MYVCSSIGALAVNFILEGQSSPSRMFTRTIVLPMPKKRRKKREKPEENNLRMTYPDSSTF